DLGRPEPDAQHAHDRRGLRRGRPAADDRERSVGEPADRQDHRLVGRQPAPEARRAPARGLVNLRLDGKTALVVGGGSGLGRAVALALAAEGANVVAAGRRADAVERTTELIESAGGAAVGVQLDLTDAGTLDSALTAARRRFGGADI